MKTRGDHLVTQGGLMKSTFHNISREKQERILHAALIEFGNKSYDAASTNTLVKNLGISKGSLFKYFESKADLYKDLLDHSVDTLLTYMDRFAPESDTQKEQLLEYAALEFDFLIEYPEMYRFFYRMQKDLNHPELHNIKEELISKAMIINSKIYGQIGISENPRFREHLVLVIAGYNRLFMERVTDEADVASWKQDFLGGLRQHLDLINWQ